MSELNITYSRDNDHNYLIIQNEINSSSFEQKMIEQNSIPGLLSINKKISDGVTHYCYDISSMQPLYRLFENREIDNTFLDYILTGLIKSYENVYNYMLSDNHIVLNPKYIFYNIDSNEIKLLFSLCYDNPFADSFISFGEYILENVNHNDSKAVMTAYRFYKLVKLENFTISSLKDMLKEIKSSNHSEPDSFCNASNEYSTDNAYRDINNSNINNEDKNYTDSINDFSSFNEQNCNPLKTSIGNMFSKLFKKDKSIELVPNNSSFDNEVATNYDTADNIPDCDIGKTVFIKPEQSSSVHTLTYLYKGKSVSYELKKLPITIGKLKENVDLVINDNSISRIHAKIYEESSAIYIQDCNSTNGTFINGLQLEAEERIYLEPGDDIVLGKFKILYT